MKVSISYRVDMKDVLSTVESLTNTALQEAEETLQHATTACQNINEDSIQKTVNNIKTLRESLISLDTQLNDYVNILVGYQNIINSPPAPPTTAPEAEDA